MLAKSRLMEHPYIEPEMITASINFWFNTAEHIRSPFPDKIKEDLLDKSIMKFLDWADKLNEAAKKEINDDILVEKFEEVLFENALDMVDTEDERITIQYPFMLRINDIVENKKDDGALYECRVLEREVVKRGDDIFLKVKLRNVEDGKVWESEFEVAG